MRRSLMPATLAFVLVIAWMAAPGAGFGAAITATPVPAATGAGGPAATIEIQMWPSEADGSSVIVSAEVPTDVKLPYTLRLPMPAGVNVTWCGEILGGNAAQDKEAGYTVEEGRGGKALVMTLTQSRIGQYEGTLPSPTQAGGRNETTLEWIQSAPAGGEHFAVKMANGAGDPTIDPSPEGTPQQNSSGERLYSLAAQKLSVGQTLKIGVSWTTVAPGSQTSQPSTSGSASYEVVLIVLVVALIAAVAALVVVAGRAKRRDDGEGAVDVPPPTPKRGRRADSSSTLAEESREQQPPSDDPFGDLD